MDKTGLQKLVLIQKKAKFLIKYQEHDALYGLGE